jgi:hypothetical protein
VLMLELPKTPNLMNTMMKYGMEKQGEEEK